MNKQSVVMIVDDDDFLRRAARRLIRSFWFAVDTFASAEDFLAAGWTRPRASSSTFTCPV